MVAATVTMLVVHDRGLVGLVTAATVRQVPRQAAMIDLANDTALALATPVVVAVRLRGCPAQYKPSPKLQAREIPASSLLRHWSLFKNVVVLL